MSLRENRVLEYDSDIVEIYSDGAKCLEEYASPSETSKGSNESKMEAQQSRKKTQTTAVRKSTKRGWNNSL